MTGDKGKLEFAGGGYGKKFRHHILLGERGETDNLKWLEWIEKGGPMPPDIKKAIENRRE